MKPGVHLPRANSRGIEPQSRGRKAQHSPLPSFEPAWVESMGASARGAKEVMVKISGGGQGPDGVQAHLEYIDRHGRLDIEDDLGQTLQGKEAASEILNEWGLQYLDEYAGHSRRRRRTEQEIQQGEPPTKRQPRQAFNIVLSMPQGVPPEKLLKGARKFAREKFWGEHRYAMVLHTDQKHPHVHLVVKAEHEHGGPRLNPRKATLHQWRQDFARYMTELGIEATATRRTDRGLIKSHKKHAIYQAAQRPPKTGVATVPEDSLVTTQGDSTFMRRKLEAVRRELIRTGSVDDREAYRKLLNTRALVLERYGAAIGWLRRQGREQEARRFESLRDALPAVRTEKQLIAEALSAGRSTERAMQRGR